MIGELVQLVPLDEDRHLENAVRWVNDTEVTDGLLIGHFPMTKLAEKDWFERVSRPSDTDVHFAIETLDGDHLGFSSLLEINFRHGTATSGSFIGAKDQWGKGYGGDAIKVRTRYAFEALGLRVLISSFLDGNERSMRMQQAAGYRECGRIPKRYWKNGRYRDEIITVLDRETWLQNNPL